jgi:hypothetical protein
MQVATDLYLGTTIVIGQMHACTLDLASNAAKQAGEFTARSHCATIAEGHHGKDLGICGKLVTANGGQR